VKNQEKIGQESMVMRFVAFACFMQAVSGQLAWEYVVQTSPWPPARQAACSAGIGDYFLIHGGCDLLCTQAFNDTWAYSLSLGIWEQITPTGPVPPPRWGAASAAVGDSGLVMFGGQHGDTFYADLWLLNFTNSSWSLLPQHGSKPQARAWASLRNIGSTITPTFILFGGQFSVKNSGVQFLSDASLYVMSQSVWNPCIPKPPIPDGVSNAQVGTTSSEILTVFGGCQKAPCVDDSDETWQLDVTQSVWTQQAAGPSARHSGASASVGSNMLTLFGGVTSSVFLSDLWLLSGNATSGWRQMNLHPSPPARGLSAHALSEDDRLIVFSGVGGPSVFQAELLTDMWLLTFPRLSVSDAPETLAPGVSSGPMGLNLGAPVPPGGSLTVDIVCFGPIRTTAVVTPTTITFSPGQSAASFSLLPPQNRVGVLTLRFFLKGPSADSFVAPADIVITVQGPAYVANAPPSVQVLTVSQPMSFNLADQVPAGGDLTVVISRTGDASAKPTPSLLVFAPPQASQTFTIDAGTVVGNLTLSFGYTGSSANLFTPPPNLRLDVTAPVDLTGPFTVADNKATDFSVSLGSPVPPGSALTVHVGATTHGRVDPSTLVFSSQSGQSQTFGVVPQGGVDRMMLSANLSGDCAHLFITPTSVNVMVQPNSIHQVSTKLMMAFGSYLLLVMAMAYCFIKRKDADALAPRSLLVAYIFWLLFGILGGHRFYLHKFQSGALYFLTLGVLGLGWLYDFFTLPQTVRAINQDRMGRLLEAPSLSTGIVHRSSGGDTRISHSVELGHAPDSIPIRTGFGIQDA